MAEGGNQPDIKEFHGEFLEESRELIDSMSVDLVALEKNPSDGELINKIFRYAHSLKGNAGFMGLPNISELAHRIESVLGKLRDKEIPFFSEINDVIFKGLDITRGVLTDFMEGRPANRDLSGIYSELESLLSGPSRKEAGSQKAGSKRRNSERGVEDSASYIRVSKHHLDRLVNLVGEMAGGRSRLSQISKEIKNKPLEEVTAFIDSISTQIQSEVLSIRMVPINQLFSKFYRLVRDVSRSLGKEAQLKIMGEETELDKTIIDLLHDPIVHMVRNAVGHGIEQPEERRRQGKPEVGTVTLRAYHEHGHVYIDVEDDGRGLNPARIREKAIEKGLIAEEEASLLSDEDAARLIFLPGLSTATDVDDLSGRGVGMSVVKANIEKVSGSIQMGYKAGAGTRFTLNLPLTLAIVQLFLIKEGKNVYGIPLGYLDGVLRIKGPEIEYIKGRRIYMLRHQPIPVMNLHDIFGMIAREEDDSDTFQVVVIKVLHERVGLIVDGLLGKIETVIKPLGKYIEQLNAPVEGISGAAILGSGEIALILDIPALFKVAGQVAGNQNRQSADNFQREIVAGG